MKPASPEWTPSPKISHSSKRARAFILLDAGYDAQTICEILDIGPTVLTEWKFSFASAGLSFFGLKD